MPAEDISTKSNAIAAVAVPPVWPHLPLIAVSKIPLFPKFIKIVDVSSCFILLSNILYIFLLERSKSIYLAVYTYINLYFSHVADVSVSSVLSRLDSIFYSLLLFSFSNCMCPRSKVIFFT